MNETAHDLIVDLDGAKALTTGPRGPEAEAGEVLPYRLPP